MHVVCMYICVGCACVYGCIWWVHGVLGERVYMVGA